MFEKLKKRYESIKIALNELTLIKRTCILY